MNFPLLFQNESDCPGSCQNGYCIQEISNSDHDTIKTHHIKGGIIAYDASCIDYCIGRLSCAEGYIYDSPVEGPVDELDVVLRFPKPKYSEPNVFLESGQKITECRKGK